MKQLILALVGIGLNLVPMAAEPTPDTAPSKTLSPIEANVFEVVVKKPVADNVVYAEKPPLDLLPFDQRQSDYRAVGTAFALPCGVFITAAHVLGLNVP